MTEQTNADLIAEAKSRAQLCDADTREAMRDTGNIIVRLAAALEAAGRRAEQAEATAEHLHDEDSREIVALTQERDAALAVIEKVRAYAESIPRTRDRDVNPGLSNRSWLTAQDVLGILASAPADALREMKAEAWDEGHDTGWEDRHQDALAGWMTSGPHESEAVNPYREEQDRD